MNNIGKRLVLMTVGLVSATVAIAQYGWQEDFGHNNAGLYTNLNGGPDNLTIEDGFARFSGVQGTFYGRTDLLVPSFKHAWHFVWSNSIISQECGPIGFGWYSPVQNAGMSVLINRDTLTLSLIEHQGFNSSVLESVAYQTPIRVYAFGKWHLIPYVGFNWNENDGWTAGLYGGDPPVFYGTQAHAGVTPTADMFFFMYGWESPTFGPGLLDWFGNSTVPEPVPLAAIVIGIGFVAIRGRNHKRLQSR